MNENIYLLFRERFAHGDAFIQSPAGATQYTYADLDDLSGRYAARLVELGATKGDRILVQVEKSAENLLLYFACLRAGLIYLPLNTAYQSHEIGHFVADAQPTIVVCDPAKVDLYRTLSTALVMTMDQHGNGTLAESIPDTGADPVTCVREDVAVILYTSGTTGKPKGAMITHGNLAANGLTLSEAWGWHRQDILLHALPIFHIHGLFVATNLAALNGCCIRFLPRFDAAQVIQLLPQSTVYMGVPTNYARLLAEAKLNREQCTNMRLFTSGSAPLLVQTFNEFRDRTGHTIVERYGMTETGMNTSNPLSGERKPGTVGPPLPGVEAKIVDEHGNPVAADTTGALCVRGANVFKGYWQMPEKTSEEFDLDGYFRTGDLASQDPDGYISLVGRSKDLVITGGLNVYPKEIEALIDDIDGVIESAVIGVPHPDFGEAVTAVVVKSKDATLTADDIIRQMKATLANFKVAKSVHFVDELPRNTMGKVQKNILREQFS